MTKIESILRKIDIVQTTLKELKREVTSLQKKGKDKPDKTGLPDETTLKAEYETLFRGFLEAKTDVVGEFIASRGKPYLIAFFRANSLPIDLKRLSKKAAISELRNWLAQRKAITDPTIDKKPQPEGSGYGSEAGRT